MRTLLVMVALAGLAAGAFVWLRTRQRHAGLAGLRVISRVGVGPRQTVVWLQAGDRELLIGATDRRIEVLADLGLPGATAQPSATMQAHAQAPLAQPQTAAQVAALATAQAAALATAQATAQPSARPSVADPAAPGRVAAFKARLKHALGTELAGDDELATELDDAMPAHLRLLTADPVWASRQDAA